MGRVHVQQGNLSTLQINVNKKMLKKRKMLKKKASQADNNGDVDGDGAGQKRLKSD